jgi:predicted nucleic acid-binding protein
MAASPVLADSSFYIGLLRQGQDPLRSLALAAATRDLAVCGVERCEVGRALRPPTVRRQFREFWDVMVNFPTDNRLWAETEQLLWDLDREGKVIPLTDAIIACSAKRIGAVVLTYKKHFSFIPDLRTTDHLEI